MEEKFYSKGELAKYLNITRPTLDAKINKLEEQGISVELNKIRDKDTGKDYFRPEDVERLVKLIRGEIDNSFTDEKQKELDSLTSKVKELERQVNVKDERIKELGEELEKVRSELEESKGLVKTLIEGEKELKDAIKKEKENEEKRIENERKRLEIEAEKERERQRKDREADKKEMALIYSVQNAKETREGILQRIKHFFLKDRTANTFTSNDSVKDDK